MLNQKDLEALIVCRLLSTADSCNSHHINHVMGQLRALAAVLKDGERPPSHFDYDLTILLDFCDIPHTIDEEHNIHWDREWMEDHGFIITPDPGGDPDKDKIEHPLKRNW